MKLNVFLLFLWLFLSRLLFAVNAPIFFDAPEYLRLARSYPFLAAISGGHPPMHPGFMIFLYMANYLRIPEVLISSLFGFLSLVILFYLVKELFDEEIAFGATILASLLPYVWISQVNILIEPLLIAFFLLSLFCFSKFLKTKANIWFILVIFTLSYAAFTHLEILFYLPAFITVFLLVSPPRQMLVPTLKVVLLGILIATLGYLLILYLTQKLNLEKIYLLFFSHIGERVDLFNFPLGTLRYFRDLLIILFRSNTPLIVLVGLLSFLRRPQLIWWFIPVFLASQYWHVGLFGRVGIFASFPLAIGVAFCLRKKRLVFLFLIGYLFLSSFPAILRLKTQASPIFLLQKMQQELPTGGLYIDSHFLRPFASYSGKTIHLNEPGTSIEQIKKEIDLMLKEEKEIYIDSEAIFDPYLSYDGAFLHIRSLGKFGISDSKPLFNAYGFKLIHVKNADSRIFAYQILGKRVRDGEDSCQRLVNSQQAILVGKGKPGTAVLVFSKKLSDRLLHQRIDYTDLLTWVWFITTGKKEPLVWIYTDRDGDFALPIAASKINNIYLKGESDIQAELFYLEGGRIEKKIL